MADINLDDMGEREQETVEQEGEDETSFTDDDQRRDEASGSTPEPDEFTRSESDSAAGRESDSAIPGRLIDIKKRFLKDIFKVTIHKGDGSNSQILYDNMEITFDKYNKFSGALYRGGKILIMREGRIEYSVGKNLRLKVKEIKEILKEAKVEHQKTPAGQVEEQLKARGLDASEEHTASVLEETDEAIGERISESRDEVLNNLTSPKM